MFLPLMSESRKSDSFSNYALGDSSRDRWIRSRDTLLSFNAQIICTHIGHAPRPPAAIHGSSPIANYSLQCRPPSKAVSLRLSHPRSARPTIATESSITAHLADSPFHHPTSVNEQCHFSSPAHFAVSESKVTLRPS